MEQYTSEESQEYRDELAKKLKDIRNSDGVRSDLSRAEAKGYLNAKKETEEYVEAKEEVVSDRKHNMSEREFEPEKITRETREKPVVEKGLNELFNSIHDELEKAGFEWSGKFRLEISYDELNTTVSTDVIVTKKVADNAGTDWDHFENASEYEIRLFDKIIKTNKDIIPSNLRPYELRFELVYSDTEAQAGREKSDHSWNSISFIYPEFHKKYWDDEEFREFYNHRSGWIDDFDIYIFKHQIGGPISSKRFKEKIEPIEDVIGRVNKLRGISFKWKSNGDAPREIGVIAEEVAKVFPELVFLDNKGKPLGVHYDRFVAVLIEAVKELNKKIIKLESK
jgi:hypothetical protein